MLFTITFLAILTIVKFFVCSNLLHIISLHKDEPKVQHTTNKIHPLIHTEQITRLYLHDKLVE